MSEIATPYIELKNELNLLEKAINDRYEEYKTNPKNNSFFISVNIKDELNKIIPPFDIELIQMCNKCLSKLDIKDDPNRVIIENELKISAEKNIYLMFSQLYDFECDDENKISVLSSSHHVFLKKEYFDIVKYISVSKYFDDYYENNLDILNQQNKADLVFISNTIKNINEKLISMSDENKFDYLNHGSSNYEIRQKEKIKEQRIQIAIDGDLTDEIEQDF